MKRRIEEVLVVKIDFIACPRSSYQSMPRRQRHVELVGRWCWTLMGGGAFWLFTTMNRANPKAPTSKRNAERFD